MLANGSEPWYQSDFLNVQELAYAFSLPVDVLRAKLKNQGIDSQPHDRFPFQVVADALVAEGWIPERLWRFR